MDPLTTEEVNALELDGSLESSVKYKQRYIDTIRDRERERDDKEYARKEWAETAHRVIMERDELQRKLDELQDAISPSRKGMVPPEYYLDVVKRMRERETKITGLAAPVQEGEGGTE